MFGKISSAFIVTLIVLSFISCTQPKYVQDPNDSDTPPGAVESEKATCNNRFLNSGLCLLWYWEKKPTSNDVGSLIFKTYRLNAFDGSAVAVDAAQIPDLILWMPSMGHGSTPTKTVQLDTGTYRAENVFFVMPGEWELKFQIKSSSSIVDEAVIEIVF